MPAQWTGRILGEMHLYGITAQQLAERIGIHPKYFSAVINGRRTPKDAEARFTAALEALIKEKSA